MDKNRLNSLLARFPAARVLVVGDFFLDRYLAIDPALAERSLETGLVAHQVFDVIATPGAAGTVAANLRALGAQVAALGVAGDDGEGYELRRGLRALGADDAALVVAEGWRTPTYTKPIARSSDGPPVELERLDIRTRAPVPPAAAELLLARLRDLAASADAVVIADQMPEPERGVITARMREELARLAARHPNTWFLADSRERIAEFRHVILKPNLRECVRAAFPQHAGEPHAELAAQAAEILRARAGRPVFVTLGAEGMLVASGDGLARVPGMRVDGPIDPVGAGDSAMAAIAAGLCAGASLEEAALLGNLAAAVTIRQIGTTGTATPAQLVAKWSSSSN